MKVTGHATIKGRGIVTFIDALPAGLTVGHDVTGGIPSPDLSAEASAFRPGRKRSPFLAFNNRPCYSNSVKLVVQVKLLPTEAQKALLTSTLRMANAACDWLAAKAFETETFGQYDLQKLLYRKARDAFPALSSQVIIRCMAKVAYAYALDQKIRRTFKPLGSIAYDSRILSWKDNTANIWTVKGRQRISFVCGKEQAQLLSFERGEADLILRKGKFFLFVTVDVPDTEETKVLDWLGVDLGIANLAVDSDGEFHSGAEVEAVRQRYADHRQRLQARGTRSAKRRLKKIAGKEARFRSIENHRISKRIVQKAKDTGRGIALEDLTGIRDRVTVRHSQRAQHAGWAFFQIRSFISYKGKLAGVPRMLVDPRNTSRRCPHCGHTDKANRKSQAVFLCVMCGFREHADVVGATNHAYPVA
jgi:IS605 OrfB family transposase